MPLLADREVRLSRSVLDAEGRPIVGEDGKREKETMAVMPSQIRDALSEARRRYAEEASRDGRGLAAAGRGGEGRLGEHGEGRGGPARPFARDGR